MKKNVPKFVLAKNETAAPGSTYIVHTQQPSFIAEILKFDKQSERDEYIKSSPDIDVIPVDSKIVVEIKKYLDSPDRDKKKEFLNKRIRHWLIANFKLL